MLYACICIVIAILLQIFDFLYHYKDLSYIKFIDTDVNFAEFRRAFKHLSSKKLDKYFVIIPFLWSYLYIVATIIFFHNTESNIIRFFLILFIAGRMRSLQEIGHFAIHGVLCPKLKTGIFLTNILFQFPTFMPEASTRRKIHVDDHHNSVNMENDPDLKELSDKGFKIGISNIHFWFNIFYYITPKGLFNRIKECWGYIIVDRFNINFFIRIFIVTFIIGIFIFLGLYNELFFLYIVPVLIVYPSFYWIAHVSLHRWFVSCSDGLEYYQRELEIGRPTNFKGISGFIIRNNIFPVGDSYHLAHSLFPAIRWTHLPQIDKILKLYCKEYDTNASFGLFISLNNYPSSISELRSRLVNN